MTMHVPVEAMGCARCPLSAGRTNVVWGSGDCPAPIMLVGEAPGYNEDRNGKPFIGRAGKHLDGLLARAGIQRSQVYISNRVKCRPPGNRDPLPAEREKCLPWLEYEIDQVRPEVVILLGRHAATFAFPGAVMKELQGTSRAMTVGSTTSLYIATYHPAAALRQGSHVDDLIVGDLIRAKEML